MWFPGCGKDKEDKPIDLSQLNAQDLADWVNSTTNSLWSRLDKAYLNSLNQSLTDLSSFISKFRDSDTAFNTPSVQQYSACLDKGGRSVWFEDGFWRCVLKGQSVPDNLKQFTDYNTFLDHQRKLLKQWEAEQEKAKNQEQQVDHPKHPPSFRAINFWQDFPGSERPRLISEEEAKGKPVVSQSSSSQTVTLDNGTLETRTKTVQRFGDGTAFVRETKDSGPQSGWFWK